MESPNPFTYTDSADAVTGKVMSMSMKNADGSPKKVANLTTPIAMRLPGKVIIHSLVLKHERITLSARLITIFHSIKQQFQNVQNNIHGSA